MQTNWGLLLRTYPENGWSAFKISEAIIYTRAIQLPIQWPRIKLWCITDCLLCLTYQIDGKDRNITNIRAKRERCPRNTCI